MKASRSRIILNMRKKKCKRNTRNKIFNQSNQQLIWLDKILTISLIIVLLNKNMSSKVLVYLDENKESNLKNLHLC